MPHVRSAVLAGALAVSAVVGVSGCGSPSSSTSATTSASALKAAPAQPQSGPPLERRREHPAGIGVADGDVPDGVTVFDGEYPAVANLDPGLLSALREAAADARKQKVVFVVNSGWRSATYQERLLTEAVAKYGSRKKAARWVAAPDRSAHVSGDAVDIGPSAAEAWLSDHGAEYGLCQTYVNEPWHYELRHEAPHSGCPTPFADAAHDPRMQ